MRRAQYESRQHEASRQHRNILEPVWFSDRRRLHLLRRQNSRARAPYNLQVSLIISEPLGFPFIEFPAARCMYSGYPAPSTLVSRSPGGTICFITAAAYEM